MTQQIEIGTKLRNIKNPEWGIFRITKTPTPAEDWYHKHGPSGASVLHKDELHFWEIVN